MTGKDLPPIPDEEEAPVSRSCRSDHGNSCSPNVGTPSDGVDPLDARRTSADLAGGEVDVDAVASALTAASGGKQTSAGREAADVACSPRRSLSDAGSRRGSAADGSFGSPPGRFSISDQGTEAKITVSGLPVRQFGAS